MTKRRRGFSKKSATATKKTKLTTPLDIDSDSLFTICSFLNTKELVSVMAVSHQFKSVARASALWKVRFLADFTPSRLEEDEVNCWFTHYMATVACIPKVAPSRRWKDLEYGEPDSDDESVDHWNERHLCGVYYTHMKLECHADKVTKRTHKLACILGLLNVNNYIPNLFDQIRVGYVDNSQVISLSQFCYAVLEGTDDRWIIQAPLSDQSDDEETKSQSHNGKTKKLKRKKKSKGKISVSETVAISPDIEGEFTPFVHYLVLGEAMYKATSNSLISNENYTSVRSFEETREDGFAPGFFNASFSWWYWVTCHTAYSEKGKYILAIKEKESQLGF